MTKNADIFNKDPATQLDIFRSIFDYNNKVDEFLSKDKAFYNRIKEYVKEFEIELGDFSRFLYRDGNQGIAKYDCKYTGEAPNGKREKTELQLAITLVGNKYDRPLNIKHVQLEVHFDDGSYLPKVFVHGRSGDLLR